MRIENVFAVELQDIRWFRKVLIHIYLGVLLGVSVPASAQEGFLFQDPHASFLWQAELASFGEGAYQSSVDALLEAYEAQAGEPLKPGETGKVALKVYSASGGGLSTPKALVKALAVALEQRGFERENITIVDNYTRGLRAAGYIAPLSVGSYRFEGMPVAALEEGLFEDPIWFYDNALPPRRPRSFSSSPVLEEERSDILTEEERRSYLPTLLFLDVDFWINLPVITDHPGMTLNGALVNATLHAVSNNERFLRSRATGPVAVAEIGAIPELREKWKLNILSLEGYQYIGGPKYNAHYVRSEPLLFLSTNATALDALGLKRINSARKEMGFDAVDMTHPMFEYAEALGLGFADDGRIEVIEVSPLNTRKARN